MRERILAGGNKQSKTKKTSNPSTKNNSNKPNPLKESDIRSGAKNLDRVIENLNKIKADTNLQLQSKGVDPPKILNNKRKNADTSQNA